MTKLEFDHKQNRQFSQIILKYGKTITPNVYLINVQPFNTNIKEKGNSCCSQKGKLSCLLNFAICFYFHFC